MANKKKGLETRKHIVETATRLFYERGMDSVSVKDICDEAGIPKSLFYYYYEDKLELATLMWRAFLKEAYKAASDNGRYSALSEDAESRTIFYDAAYLSLLKDKQLLKVYSDAIYAMPKFWFSGNGISFGASAYQGRSRGMERKDFDMLSSFLGVFPLMVKRLLEIGDSEVTPEEFVIYFQFLSHSYFERDTGKILETVTRQVEIASENLIDLSAIFLRIPELMFPEQP